MQNTHGINISLSDNGRKKLTLEIPIKQSNETYQERKDNNRNSLSGKNQSGQTHAGISSEKDNYKNENINQETTMKAYQNVSPPQQNNIQPFFLTAKKLEKGNPSRGKLKYYNDKVYTCLI